jgi:hypothetical protein
MKPSYILAVCGGFLGLVAFLTLPGCMMEDGRPTIIPNADANLRKTSTEFAADAAKRSYESDAPKANVTIARAQYSLLEERFDLANLTNWNWKNVEVWVNQRYVVDVPQLAANSGEGLNFQMFYDNQGHHFDTDWGNNPIKSVQIYADGKMYDVVATLQ